MNELTNPQLVIEIRKMRAALDPIINLQFKELLIEIEKRLNGVGPGSLNSKKPQQRKRPTKKEAYFKYLYK